MIESTVDGTRPVVECQTRNRESGFESLCYCFEAWTKKKDIYCSAAVIDGINKKSRMYNMRETPEDRCKTEQG